VEAAHQPAGGDRFLIPRTFLQEWSARAPWPDLRQVEQDLVISRALCDLFGAPALAGKIAFRGGTAIHKLLFRRPLRYSEDIDLVQTRPEAIGATVDAVREALAWLGRCRRDQAEHSIHLTFRFAPEAAPDTALRLKIEINTREHASLLGARSYPFEVASAWHEARADIASFEPEELLGTKLRALLQRSKGRDLFDLGEGLRQLELDPGKIVACCEHYLALEGNPVSRAEAEQRMLAKLNRSLTEDIDPLLPAGVRYSDGDALESFGRVWTQLIARMRGEPWKLTGKTIAQLRETKYPGLLRDSGAGASG
jgi:predicted nucleotidyltransferase component of viral defense system